MGRIRSIKPEFWTSAQVVEMSPTARLLFVGLWNFCDDGGRHPASPKTLKMEVLPGDNFTTEQIAAWVGEMIEQGLVFEYEVDTKRYWQVTGWHHQRMDKPTYRHPKPPVGERSASSRRAVGEQSGTESIGEESIGEESIKKEKKGDIDFQSETSEMPTEKAPPVAPAPPTDDADLDPEQVARKWFRADNFKWLQEVAAQAGYDPSATGVTVNDKVSLFCGHHADNEAFQSDPIAFFKRHFKGYLVIGKSKAPTKPAAKPRNAQPIAQPTASASDQAYTVETVVAMFRSRYGPALADSLAQSQQRRLTEAKNEAELALWMEGIYNSLKGGKQGARSGPVSLGSVLPNS